MALTALDGLPTAVLMIVDMLRDKLAEAASAPTLDEVRASISEALSDLEHLRQTASLAVPYVRSEQEP